MKHYSLSRGKLFFLITLLFCSGSLVSANEDRAVYFSNLNLKNGLSQLSILSICEDAKGYMWFATRNGLNRYDGEQFTVYKHENESPYSLSYNHTTVIVPAPLNKGLWIGTINGLNYLDFSTDCITSYHREYTPGLVGNDILSLCFDAEGRLIVGTRTGLCYLSDSNEFTPLPLKQGEEDEPVVQALYKDRSGTLFIGTQNQGLWRCRVDLRPSQVLSIDTQPAVKDNCVTALFEDSRGQLWIGSQTQGVYCWDRNSNLLKNYTRQNSGLTDNNIRCFQEYNGGIMVGTFDGLSMLNLSDNTLSRYHIFDVNQSNLSHFSVYSVYVDKVGTLWVGTYAGGINYYNPLSNRFIFHHPQGNHMNEIYGVFGTMLFHDGGLWMATEGGGLLRFDPHTRSYTNYLLDEQRGSHHNRNIIKSLMHEGDYIWCGTNHGAIYRFHIPTCRFSLYHQFDRNQSLGIYTMCRDQEGSLWVGTTLGKGLWRFTSDGKRSDRFPVGKDSAFVNFSSVRSFLELRQDVYLIGTRSYGLYKYDAAGQTLTRYNTTEADPSRRLESDYITSILRKEDGDIWIGTFGGGAYLFDESEGIRRKVNVSGGLPNNNVYALVEYNNNLWISLDKGITELKTTGEIRNYDSLNGLEALEFTPGGGICLPDGEIYFSGSNGFLSFRPGDLIENTYLPPIVLTGLTVNNQAVTPGDNTGLLTCVPDDIEELVLAYDQNNFSIAYCAMNYIYHSQNRYAYQLEGHDTGWNQVGTRKEAFYTNIAPGKYTFRVIASNNDGHWNESGKSIHITILSPWWKTPWAYLGYLLLFLTVTGTIGYYIYTKKRLEHNLRIRQQEKQRLEEFHQTKVRLFTNFSHELRTPLTLVISPLEEILQQPETPAMVRDRLQLVLRNSRRLFLLVNQLMDLQKNQSGHLKLELSETDINAFLREIYYTYRQIAEGRRIEFRYEAPTEKIQGCFDVDLLEKAVFNLLSNAFKFTISGESVVLSLNILSGEGVKKEFSMLLAEEGYEPVETSSYFVIRVADTGKGIPEEERKHIFAPFYQVTDIRKAADNAHGTGIGLSLTQSVVKLHQGMIGVSAHEPKGTVFTMIIPNDRTAYRKEDFTSENNLPVVVPSTSEAIVDILPDKTILLVEDNPDIRTYISQHLAPYYRVLEAAEGTGAFELILQEYPDLVVSDIMMPGIDGLELCQMIKDDLRTSHIPVILLTARTMVIHIKEGYRTGADDYMVKPFHMDVLLIRIHNLLSQREKLKSAYGKTFSLESLGIETTSADEKFMQKLFEVIERHLSNPNLKVELICEEMGFSRTNFYRKIKAITDLSLNDLIRTKRLEVAAHMLCETDKNVSEVSMATGFSTLAYFTRCFKIMYGITPTEYIKSKNGINLQTSGTQE